MSENQTDLKDQDLNKIKSQNDLNNFRIAEMQRIAHIGSWEWDINANKIIWSDELYRIYGLNPDTFGASFEAFIEQIHPEDRENIKKIIDLVLKEHKTVEFEERIIRPDGSIRYLESKAEVSLDESGKPVCLMGLCHDITEKKEKKFTEESKEKMNNILESITDAFFSFDFEWRFTYINNEAEKILKGPREEFLGKTLLEVFPDTGKFIFYDEYQKAMNEQKLVSFEEYYPHLDTWLSIRAFPSKTGLLVYMQNISEKKKIELGIKYQDYLRQSITDNATAALFMIDKNGYCTFMNPAAELMTGFTFAEITQKPLHEMIHYKHPDGKNYPIEECPIERALPQNNDIRAHEDFFLRKNGTFYPVKVAARPVFENGEAISTVIEVRDVTEEKRANEELKKSEENFKFMAETIPQLVWTARPDGFTDYFNSRWEDYLGFMPLDRHDNNWDSIIHPDDAPKSMEAWLNAMKIGEAYNVEYRLRRNDGVYRWHISRAEPLRNEKGEVTKWFGTATDIEEQKRIEEVQKFLSNASHQLISSVDYETTLKKIAELAVPFFADWCRIDIYNEKEHCLDLLALSHQNPEKIELALDFNQKFPPDPDALSGSANVIRTGQSELFNDIPEELIRASISNKEQLDMILEIGLKSVLTVPLNKDGKSFGAITFVNSESGRNYSEEDVIIAEDLAKRASLAISNAELYKKLQDEISIKETLYRIGSLLTAELDVHKLVQIVTDECTTLIGAEFGSFFYNVINNSGESYMLYTISGVPREMFSNFPMPRNTEIFAPTFNGEGVVRLSDVTKDPRYGKSEPYFGMPKGHLPVKSYLAVPVISRSGEVLGGLFFGHSQVGVFQERAEEIVSAIASQAAIAVDNAQLYTQTKDAEEKFRVLTEAIDPIVWTSDAKGNIEHYNQRWHDYSGTVFQENNQTQLFEHIHPDDLKESTEEWQEALKNKSVYKIESRLKDKNGDYHWFLIRAVPLINEDNQIIKWFGTCTEIDILKETENKLETQREELQIANQELERFAYVASHDLSEPLRTISGYAQLLERRYKNKLDSDANDFIGLITDGAKRMRQLIDDLLEYSRVGTLKMALKETNLNTLLEEVLFNLDAGIKENEAVITYDKMPNLKVEPTLITQLFQNLISNSIKYRKKDEKPVIHISVNKNESDYIFSIKDNGIGINSNYFEKIFVIFQRLHGKYEYSGTGIGLATCKKIVAWHRGTIWLESEEGKGSNFFFSLPI